MLLVYAAIFVGSVFCCFRKKLWRHNFRKSCDNRLMLIIPWREEGQKGPEETAFLQPNLAKTMTRIKYLGRTIREYLRYYQDVPPPCDENCPDCNRKLYKHGRYYRMVITGKKARRIPIYRWYCPACGKTFSLLPDFLFRYQIHSGQLLQRAWLLRYVKGRSYSFIQTYFSQNVLGGVSYKTVKRWDRLWKGPLKSLVQFLLSSTVEIKPFAFEFQKIKHLTVEQLLLFLLPLAWEISHPTTPYPSCGYFQWINQLREKI